MTMAAVDLQNSNEKVIDIALNMDIILLLHLTELSKTKYTMELHHHRLETKGVLDQGIPLQLALQNNN